MIDISQLGVYFRHMESINLDLISVLQKLSIS